MQRSNGRSDEIATRRPGAADDRTLYVQDQRRQWYRATLFTPCFDLPFAQAIGFETSGIDTFDRFSTIRVRGERCSVSSPEKSDAPPAKAKRARSQAQLTGEPA